MTCLLVTGVNGVGKSTVIRQALHAVPAGRHFSASSALMTHFRVAPQDYAALDAVPLEDRVAASGALLAEAIAAATAPLLLDAHLLSFEEDVPRDCGGSWVAALDGIVLLTAPARDIVARLSADAARGRTRRWLGPSADGSEHVAVIERRQNILARHVRRTGSAWSVPVHCVANSKEPAIATAAVAALLRI
ncbi:AAA family ATPase [Streptomyces achromogenes]|uniref:AAA family ATPase n=1 Tax=Streptomyces achromogenes TaxID=67255 RepID=UPI00370058BA